MVKFASAADHNYKKVRGALREIICDRVEVDFSFAGMLSLERLAVNSTTEEIISYEHFSTLAELRKGEKLVFRLKDRQLFETWTHTKAARFLYDGLQGGRSAGSPAQILHN